MPAQVVCHDRTDMPAQGASQGVRASCPLAAGWLQVICSFRQRCCRVATECTASNMQSTRRDSSWTESMQRSLATVALPSY